MLEFYEAYADYNDAAERHEHLVADVAERVLGTTTVERDGARSISPPPWRRLTLRDAIRTQTGIDVSSIRRVRRSPRRSHRAEPRTRLGQARRRPALEGVEPTLIEPTFSWTTRSRCRRSRSASRDERLIERWEADVAGFEI